jgi:hypothetical protein
MRTRLVPLFTVVFALQMQAQSPGMFSATGSMITPRAAHTATLLANGKVLFAGGVSKSFPFPSNRLASAELYDPSTGTFAATGDMATARGTHTATLLPNGKVLIAGGFVGPGDSITASAELYDPSTGSFTSAGAVVAAQEQALHTATLLPNGKVLIAGIGSKAQLYDPAAGTFSEAGPYADRGPWLADTATLLADGSVLITGCTTQCEAGFVQIYDSSTNSFSAIGGPKPGCEGYICWYADVNTATLLPDGKVLIAGNAGNDGFPADAELYDPLTGTFASLGYALGPHEFSAATLIPDGTVLLTGGQLPGGYGDPGAELFRPGTGAFSLVARMNTGRHSHTATLLPDGTVLIAGGYLWPEATASAEIYHPGVLTRAPALEGAILHAGTSQPASPANPAAAGVALEIYLTGLLDGSVIPPQVSIGGRLAEVLWFGNAPGFAGLNQINVRVPKGITPGPDVPVTVTYLGRPGNAVAIGLR